MARRTCLLVVTAGVVGISLGAFITWFVTNSSIFSETQPEVKSSEFFSEFTPEILSKDAVPEKCQWTEVGHDFGIEEPSPGRGATRIRRFTALCQEMRISPTQFMTALLNKEFGDIGSEVIMDAKITGGMCDNSPHAPAPDAAFGPICYALRYRAGKFSGTIVITGTNPEEKARPR
jgi:hypothetical protein